MPVAIGGIGGVRLHNGSGGIIFIMLFGLGYIPVLIVRKIVQLGVLGIFGRFYLVLGGAGGRVVGIIGEFVIAKIYNKFYAQPN